MGVIVKRPIANAAWRHAQKPENTYVQPYWERLQKLTTTSSKADPEKTAAIALGFTLSFPGVHTAIVGTLEAGRWRENAAMLECRAAAHTTSSRPSAPAGARWPTRPGSARSDGQFDVVGRSGEQSLDDLAVHVGQPEVAALEAIGQPGVVEAQQMQQRRVQVVDVNLVLDDLETRARRFRRSDTPGLMPPPAIHIEKALG